MSSWPAAKVKSTTRSRGLLTMTRDGSVGDDGKLLVDIENDGGFADCGCAHKKKASLSNIYCEVSFSWNRSSR